jgi:hypothetical protein
MRMTSDFFTDWPAGSYGALTAVAAVALALALLAL